MPLYQFILAIVLGLYVGFARLHQLRYIAKDPLLAGILKITHLPPQSTFWRFLNSLHAGVARQILSIQRRMREAVWAAGNIQLHSVTIDTDTTVHTLYGKQMGARKSYNPKNKGKKSYQPILSFIAETKEFVAGELRNGDRPTGKQIGRHLQEVFQSLPHYVTSIFARADSGFYCCEAVEAYEKFKCWFIVVARKTSRLVDELTAAEWKPSPHTDADEQCEFWYQPTGWDKAYRFIALRYENDCDDEEESDAVQYQLFATKRYRYRVFVTNMEDPIDKLVWFYNQRAGAENLIKESNNDAGLAAHPSRLFVTNQIHFQLAMLAYNLNAWLMLFNRNITDNRSAEAHYACDFASAIFVHCCKDLAAFRSNRSKFWRSLSREGTFPASHAAAAIYKANGEQLRTRCGEGPVMMQKRAFSQDISCIIIYAWIARTRYLRIYEYDFLNGARLMSCWNFHSAEI
jgi:hypothetical protein